MFEGLRFRHWRPERDADGIVVLTLDRADLSVNALGRPVLGELQEIVERLSFEPPQGLVIRSGKPASFVVGADLNEFAAYEASGTVLDVIEYGQRVFQELARLPCPTVAAIHGACIGGGLDLAAACDVRLASADAKISLREVKVAIVADLGSLQRLPAIIGQGHTRELAFTGKTIDAARAMRIGLVNDVLATPEELSAAAEAMAREIAGNPPLTVRGVKDVLAAGEGKTAAEGLAYVAAYNAAFLASEDLGEAMAAFLQKREPQYKGR